MEISTCLNCADAPALPNSRYCEPCGKMVRAERAERKLAEWSALCPAAFRQTDVARLPDQRAHAAAMKHEFKNGRGLMLNGVTGGGKSRTAWLLAARDFDAGRTVVSMTPKSALEYGATFADGCDAALAWVNDRTTCDLLVLDDVFKCKFTEAFEGIIFAIVDERTQNLKPMLVTTNDSSGSLKGRLTDDRGEPLLRRLCEFCDVIKFNGGAK